MTNHGEKGRQFERDFSRLLSLWWTKGDDEDVFWRTDSSGARATTRAKVGKTTANAVGDISSRTPEGDLLLKYFIIELKRGYSKLEVLSLLDKNNNKTNLLLTWWQKLIEEGAREHKKVMLVFRRDRAHACIMFQTSLLTMLINRLGAPEGNVPHLMFTLCGIPVTCMRFEDFTTWVDPDQLKELFKSYENSRSS